MMLSNLERAVRCRTVLAGYAGDDEYTNLVDFLADAMHFCHLEGQSVSAALDSALMHFEAEKSDELKNPITDGKDNV